MGVDKLRGSAWLTAEMRQADFQPAGALAVMLRMVRLALALTFLVLQRQQQALQHWRP